MAIFGKQKKDKIVQNEVKNEGENFKIKLYLTEDEKARMSNIQIQYLEDELLKLPKIEEGQVNFASEYFTNFDGKIETKVFIRNASHRPINFDKLELGIKDENGNIIKKQLFDLKYLGDIPSYSARVTKLFFEPDEIDLDNINYEKLEICLAAEVRLTKSVETEFESLPENLTEAQVAMLNKSLDELGRLEENNITLSAIDLLRNEEGKIIITIIARNGYSQEIGLQECPISVFDSENDKVASVRFKFDNLKLLPKKAKLFNLILEKENVIKNDCDLSNWKVTFN